MFAQRFKFTHYFQWCFMLLNISCSVWCFLDNCLSLFRFSFDHCIGCPSSIDGFLDIVKLVFSEKNPLKIRICTLLIFYLSIKYTLTVNEFMITNILVLGSMVEQFLLCYWSVNYIQLLRSLSLLVLNKSGGIGILLQPREHTVEQNSALSHKLYYNKGNNKITELRTILQRESQNSYVYKQTKSVNNRKTVQTVMTLTWYRNGGLNQILKRQTSRFHYGSKVPAVTTIEKLPIMANTNIF